MLVIDPRHESLGLGPDHQQGWQVNQELKREKMYERKKGKACRACEDLNPKNL